MTNIPPETGAFPLYSDTDLSLNLDRQRRLAKTLRDHVRQGEADARARVSAHHPRGAYLDLEAFKLVDAQCVIAREAGLPSWPALKAHVEAVSSAGDAIEAGGPAPDGDMPTLHIRCGNDIEGALGRAGFEGEFLEYSDPVCQGPLIHGPSAQAARARFIASEYVGVDEAECLTGLNEADERLSTAGDFARIVLWFEHDPYDQMLLVKILSRLQEAGATGRKIELVSIDRFPGLAKFIGLGQLSPAALRHMFNERQPLAEAAYALARRTWEAMHAPTPEPLWLLASAPNPTLPFLPSAILRYLAELPSPRNGLSFTEEGTLRLLTAGPVKGGRLFGTFMQDVDPLPFWGDLMYLGTLIRLCRAERPALICETDDFSYPGWGRAEFSLTEAGQALLSGDLDWGDSGPQPRQIGGYTCFDGADWRFDAKTDRLTAQNIT